MTEQQVLIADALFDLKMVKFGDYPLRSGARTPIYVDLRNLHSHVDLFIKVVSLLTDIAKTLDYDRLAGLPYAATSLQGALIVTTKKPALTIRKEPQPGRERIQGVRYPGETILIVDDVVTDGGTKILAFEPLEAEGLLVPNLVVVVDRDQGGRELLMAQMDVGVYAGLHLRGMLHRYRDTDRIDLATHDRVIRYLKNERRKVVRQLARAA